MRDHGSPRPAGGGGGGIGERPWVSWACWGPAGGGGGYGRDHGSHSLGGGTELWWLIPWLHHQG